MKPEDNEEWYQEKQHYKITAWAGEIATHPEDLSTVPSIHENAWEPVTLAARDPTPLLASEGTCTHMALTYTDTHIHKNKNNKNKS